MFKQLTSLLTLAALAFLVTLAIQPTPAVAQVASDGTTLNDFVLDAGGYAWFKVRPYGASSLKPNPQLRYIADPGNARGGTALHPDSHREVEDIIRDVIRSTGSIATWEIAWADGATGFGSGYQVRLSTDRGSGTVSAGQIGLLLMKYGREATKRRLIGQLADIL